MYSDNKTFYFLTRFHDPRALSSVLAALGSLQPQGPASNLDPYASFSNYNLETPEIRKDPSIYLKGP